MSGVARVEVVLPGRSLSTPEGSLGFCGTYLVTAGDGIRILFDPGHIGRRRALTARLADLGIDPEEVGIVVLSHAHWDHAQNVDAFPRARVLAHRPELADVSDSDHPLDIATPRWTTSMLAAVGATAVDAGDELAPGVATLALPGHTRGSMGLRVQTATGVAVLTGDAISRRDIAVRGTAAMAHHDAEAGRRSIADALSAADHIWPGHDAPFAVECGEVGEYLFPKGELELIDHAR